MKYRALSSTGDYVFGRRVPPFLTNSPEAVAQAVRTRLDLWEGEWFLDEREGTPYLSKVLGTNTLYTKDTAIKERVLDTPGVKSILSYYSTTVGRAFTVSMTIETIYGTADVASTITG